MPGKLFPGSSFNLTSAVKEVSLLTPEKRHFRKKRDGRAFLSQLAAGTGTGIFPRSPFTLAASRQQPCAQSFSLGSPTIEDIRWEMGPALPWPSKGQAQAVIGENILGAGGAQLLEKLPPEFNHRRHADVARQHIFNGVYMPWGLVG